MKVIVAGLSMSKLPDFEGLAMFAKVAEERSFAAAARTMGVSVATVSRAVTRLEERLGGRLFNRTSRRLALTDFGHMLAERATKIYAEAKEAEDFARETSSRPRGLVKLAAPLSFGARWVAPLLPEFFRTYPDISVDASHGRPCRSDWRRLRRGHSRSDPRRIVACRAPGCTCTPVRCGIANLSVTLRSTTAPA
jgi:DNA-binding transcriptional LysR family regulator